MKYKESSYSKLLRDSRWQRKRLEVLERDNWECQMCFDSEATLHVHHVYYEVGFKPWDYNADSLVTLCENCHKIETENLKIAQNRFIKAVKSKPIPSHMLNKIADAWERMQICYHDEPLMEAICVFLENEDAKLDVLMRCTDWGKNVN
jgi:hypothetical protein